MRLIAAAAITGTGGEVQLLDSRIENNVERNCFAVVVTDLGGTLDDDGTCVD